MAKNPPANAGVADSISGLGRPPEEGNGNPFHYSCLENPMNRGAWWATVHGVAESDTMEATECARLVSLQRLQPCRRMVSDKE